MYTITLIAGARPNFMKIAPILHELQRAKKKGIAIAYRLVHTGQHYDTNMSGCFFEQLDMPLPHINLNCSGGSQAKLTANILLAIENELITHPPDLVLVVGDVTSTMACALAAKKLHIPVAHVEGGIRSGDMRMPEEVNRLVTDSITDYYFTTTAGATHNLISEGVDKNKCFLVGNTMIDTLKKNAHRFFKPQVWDLLKLQDSAYIVLTMHRPANVDAQAKLEATLNELIAHTRDVPIVFPAHPRTQKMLKRLDIKSNRLHIIEPLSYLEFNYMVKHAKAVITDSGGITEEAAIMNVPCLTLRDHTERPETIHLGTNVLIGSNPEHLKPHLELLFKNQWKQAQPIPLWDGHAAKRIVSIISDQLIKN